MTSLFQKLAVWCLRMPLANVTRLFRSVRFNIPFFFACRNLYPCSLRNLCTLRTDISVSVRPHSTIISFTLKFPFVFLKEAMTRKSLRCCRILSFSSRPVLPCVWCAPSFRISHHAIRNTLAGEITHNSAISRTVLSVSVLRSLV